MDKKNNLKNIQTNSLEFGLLTVIASAGVTAAEIAEELRRHHFHFEEANLFPMLQKLRREKLIESTWVSKPDSRPSKEYSLTEKGSETLATLRITWENVHQRMNSILNKQS